jgi:hypothetical protein
MAGGEMMDREVESEQYALAYRIIKPLEGRCEPHLQQQVADRIVRALMQRESRGKNGVTNERDWQVGPNRTG